MVWTSPRLHRATFFFLHLPIRALRGKAPVCSERMMPVAQFCVVQVKNDIFVLRSSGLNSTGVHIFFFHSIFHLHGHLHTCLCSVQLTMKKQLFVLHLYWDKRPWSVSLRVGWGGSAA